MRLYIENYEFQWSNRAVYNTQTVNLSKFADIFYPISFNNQIINFNTIHRGNAPISSAIHYDSEMTISKLSIIMRIPNSELPLDGEGWIFYSYFIGY